MKTLGFNNLIIKKLKKILIGNWFVKYLKWYLKLFSLAILLRCNVFRKKFNWNNWKLKVKVYKTISQAENCKWFTYKKYNGINGNDNDYKEIKVKYTIY